MIATHCIEQTVEVAVVAQFHSDEFDEVVVAATLRLSEWLRMDFLERMAKFWIHSLCPHLMTIPCPHANIDENSKQPVVVVVAVDAKLSVLSSILQISSP